MPAVGCLDCSRQLRSIEGLLSHCSALHHRFGCKPCRKQFVSLDALEQHIRPPAHEDSDNDDSSTKYKREEKPFNCFICDRFFIDAATLNWHFLNSPMHNWCLICSKDFKTVQELGKHLSSPEHGREEPKSLDQRSSPPPKGKESNQSINAMPPFGCVQCPLEFSSIPDLREHCRTKGHSLGCKTCGKCFKIKGTSLEQHLRDSPAHRVVDTETGSSGLEGISEESGPSEPTEHIHSEAVGDEKKSFDCLFCEREFRFPSAIAMHIESGSHNITRHQVTMAVHKLGIVPTISVDRRLTAPIEAPTAIITYSATEEAFNGKSYKCYLCACMYATLRGLNAHLNSPAHDADEFKCPKCKIQFKLVSGLIQHIESGTCAIAKFKEVQGHFENLTDQFSRALKI